MKSSPISRLFGIQRHDMAAPIGSRAALEKATFEHLTGTAAEHLPVTRADAMSIAAVARGRHIITGTIARLPLVTMRGNTPASAAPLLDKPEAGRPRFQTLAWTVDAMLFFGRAWWIVQKRSNEDDRPVRVEWTPEWEIDTNERGQIITAYGRPVNPADVIRIDAPHEGLLTFAAPRLRAAMRLDRAALVAADNPVPSVELHQTGGRELTDEEITGLIDAYAAARRRTGISFTNQSMETKVHGTTPENLLITGRDASALDIARVMNLPAWAVDAPTHGSSMTYSNVPSRARELLDYTLAPYMEAICARLSEDDVLPRGTWCRFDSDSLTADDFGTRMASYKTAVESGVYTVEDLKARELGTPLETVKENEK